MRGSRHSAVRSTALLLAALLLVASAGAEVRLRFLPEYQAIAPGEFGQLSVFMEDSLDLRTVELWTSFDPAVLLSQDGVPGDRFIATGCDLFPDFVLTSSSEWYGGVAILGSDCWATGPGELFRWTFSGGQSGLCHVESIEVRLYSPDAVLIEDVSLASARVRVDEAVGVGDQAFALPYLKLHPNPCNPRLQIELAGSPGRAELDLLSIEGRVLTRVWEGSLADRPRIIVWRGIDADGNQLPSGLYLLRLRCSDGLRRFEKVVLLR